MLAAISAWSAAILSRRAFSSDMLGVTFMASFSASTA